VIDHSIGAWQPIPLTIPLVPERIQGLSDVLKVIKQLPDINKSAIDNAELMSFGDTVDVYLDATAAKEQWEPYKFWDQRREDRGDELGLRKRTLGYALPHHIYIVK